MAAALLKSGAAHLGTGAVLVNDHVPETFGIAPLLVEPPPGNGTDARRGLRAFAQEKRIAYQQAAAQPKRAPDADADASPEARLRARPPLGESAKEHDRFARADERARIAQEIIDEENRKHGGL
jgi:hypothetical protein